MPCLFRCAGLVMVALALLGPALCAQDQKTGDVKKDDTKDTKKKDKPKPDWSAEFVGKLTAMNDKEDERLSFTVHVNYKIPELDTGAQQRITQHQQTLAKQQLQLARAKTPQEMQNILNNIASTSKQLEQAKAQLYRAKDVNLDVKCQAADNMRVRRFAPMQVIDPETGEYVKMTKELLAEAKGREGYPGYKADTRILEQGQTVQIYVWKETVTPALLLEKNKKEKAKIEDLQKKIKNLRYEVIMIQVLADAPKGKMEFTGGTGVPPVRTGGMPVPP